MLALGNARAFRNLPTRWRKSIAAVTFGGIATPPIKLLEQLALAADGAPHWPAGQEDRRLIEFALRADRPHCSGRRDIRSTMP